MFSHEKMEAPAKRKYPAPLRFAKHLQDNYDKFAVEFPVFGEVERSARVVSIARWLAANYPEVARKLVDDAYVGVKVYVPQVIKAKWVKTHEGPTYVGGLIGGVTFPNVNRYADEPTTKIANTNLSDVPDTVMKSRPEPTSLAWQAQLGGDEKTRYTAWKITARPSVNAGNSLDAPQRLVMGGAR